MNRVVVNDGIEYQRNVKKAYYLVFDPKKLTYAHSLCQKMMADRVLKVTLKTGQLTLYMNYFPGYVETKKRKRLTVSLVVGDLSTKVKIF